MSTIYVPPIWTVRPTDGGELGIVCGSELMVFRNKDPRLTETCWPYTVPLGEAANDVATLAALAYEHRVGSLWLLPCAGAQPAAGDASLLRAWMQRAHVPALREAHPEYTWHELTAKGSKGSSAMLGGLVVQRRNAEGESYGALLRIYAPWVQDVWPIRLEELPAGLDDRARVLAAGLLLAQHLLGVQLRFSPSYSGLVLLRQTLSQSRIDVDLSPLSSEWLDWLLSREHRAHPLQWRRPLETSEPDGGDPRATGRDRPVTLHKYDRNASYVSSARTVPCGEPEKVSEYRPGRQGIYRFTAQAPAEWSPCTPGPFHVGQGAGSYPLRVEDTWAWEPHIRLALKWGWEVAVHEGYAWPKTAQHDLFRPWQERVWAARRETANLAMSRNPENAHIARIASRIVKRVGLATIGRLLQVQGRSARSVGEAESLDLEVTWMDVNEAGDFTGMAEVKDTLGRADLLHPEWWSIIIANANERLLNATYTNAPADTLGLFVDALYTLEPHEQLAGDPLKTGGFRHAGTVTLPRGDIDRSASAASLVKALARAGRLEEEGE